ncbi:hypothetical protein [Brevibacterium marinum]|uniref:DNA primase n=1 Tax=Brevibacterium marinum TaxID=418643 RepID=A0A846RWZ8_9MICO|nr:hypothetical protein [Brevibacterium marinum]NJC56486.1 hypothetical protein [Brevibacterium marinum]
MKITGLILAGYMLGRTKKLGLALTIASSVAGSTAVKNRDNLIGGLKEFADSSPELKSLQEKVTGRLADSGKSAAKAMAAKGVDQLSARLQDQTDKMKATLDATAEDLDPTSEEPEDSGEEEAADVDSDAPEDDAAVDAEDEQSETEDVEEPAAEEEPPKKSAPRKRSSSSSSSSRKGATSKTTSTARGAGSKSTASKTSSTKKRSAAAKKPSTSRKSKEATDEGGLNFRRSQALSSGVRQNPRSKSSQLRGRQGRQDRRPIRRSR